MQFYHVKKIIQDSFVFSQALVQVIKYSFVM